MLAAWQENIGQNSTGNILTRDLPQFDKNKNVKKLIEFPTASIYKEFEHESAIDLDFDYSKAFETFRTQLENQKISNLTQEITELKNLVKKISKELFERESSPIVIQTHIYNFESSEYQTTMPIGVILKIYKDEVISLLPELELYGEGLNEVEALNSLKLEILDLFDDLNEMKDEELDKAPKSWKKTLNQLIKKCP